MGSLERDYTVVPGQLYACLSIVGPDRPQRSDQFAIKIRGCFATKDEAANHAKRLQKEDATFDIYVVDMFQWLVIPPKSEEIQDTHYVEDKLEEMMTAYRENQAQARKLFEERKRDMMAKPTGTEMPYIKPGDENSKYYTKPDEAPISHPADILERLQKEKPDASMEDLVKEADAIVAKEIEERKKERGDLETVQETEEKENDKEQEKLNNEDDATDLKKLEEELEAQKKADEEAERQRIAEEEAKKIKEAEEEAERQRIAEEEAIRKDAEMNVARKLAEEMRKVEEAEELKKIEEQIKVVKDEIKETNEKLSRLNESEEAKSARELEEERMANKREKERKRSEDFSGRMNDEKRREATDGERKKKKSGSVFSKLFGD